LLLRDLRASDSSHSWQAAFPPERLDHVSNALRPTTLFTYFARESASSGAQRIPVAVAAVSEQVSRDFAHRGFPVIARCTIRELYRGMGLYRWLLRHRFEVCRSRWGVDLNAVHIGAANPAVLATVLHTPEFSPGFLYVGDESLRIGDARFEVPDFLWLSERYRLALLTCAEGAPWIGSLRRFLAGGAEAVPIEELRPHRGDCLAMGQLFELLEAIGVGSCPPS